MKWMLMPLRRYAEFRGRSRRLEFWLFSLFMAIVYILFIGAVITTASPQSDTSPVAAVPVVVVALLMGLFWLATLIPTLAVQVRRLHDTDRSGWWVMLWAGPMLLSYVMQIFVIATYGAANAGAFAVVSAIMGLAMFVGGIVLLIFFCLPGTRGENRFGTDPLGDTTDALAETFA
jgi:uncharacterized membrane protein YhaH (DUF805 family)